MSYTLFHPTYTDGAQRHTSKTWNVRFKDHFNRRQTLAGWADKRRTTGLADKIQKLIECRQRGAFLPDDLSKWMDGLEKRLMDRLTNMDLIDATTLSADRPLLEHLDGRKDEAGNIIEPGYRQAILARGTTEGYAKTTCSRIRSILAECSFAFWKQLIAPGAATRIEVWLGERRADGEINGKTFNYFIRDFRGFCRWLAAQGRAPGIALQNLKKVKNAGADSDRRRSLSVDEMRRLVKAAAAGEPLQGLSGDDRAILYRFAFETGIRSGEIKALVVQDFALNADPPTVTSQGRNVKRRIVHVQELRPALAAELRRRFANRRLVDQLPEAPAFKMPKLPAKMLRSDLAAARRAWINEGATDQERIERTRGDFLADLNHAGEWTVFYSTRHGHGTALADAGVPEKDIAHSMHHTSTATTARYLHADRASLHKAIAQLPDLDYPAANVATGTEGPCAGPCATMHSSVASGGVGGGSALESGRPKSLGKTGENAISSEELTIGLLAELADALDSKSNTRKGVSVRLR